MKPTQNLNSGPCRQCDTEDTVELTVRNAAEGCDDTVRWCANGHVTCLSSGTREWKTVFSFNR